MARQKKQKTRFAGVFRLNDGRWWIEASQRDHQGQRVFRRRVLEEDTTIDAAARERAALVMGLEQELKERATHAPGGDGEGAGRAAESPTTVASYATQWLQRKAPRLKDSTAAHYIEVLGSRILPVLGHVPVTELRRSHIEEWLAWAEQQRRGTGEPYAQDTMRGWWRVTVSVLRDLAAEHGLPDPTARLKPPRSTVRGRRERRTLTIEEVKRLLAAVSVRHPSWYDEVFVTVFSGMRPGELYALEYDDVDEREGLIHIRRSVRRGKVGTTKTDDPRDAALTGPLRRLLTDRRRRMLVEQQPGIERGLVFPAVDGGYRGSEALLKVLGECCEAARLPVKAGPQVLRRTFNTLSIQAKVDRTVLRAQMGHCSEEMTVRYTGVHPTAKREAVEMLFDMVAGSGEGDPGSTSR